MADEIIFIKLGPNADSILDAFAERTGLEGEDEGDSRTFAVDGAEDHEVKVVKELTAIDEDWTFHLGLEQPA